jgi:diaminopimelate decarboxylase
MNEQLTLQRATTKPLTLTPRVHPQVSRFVHESNKLPELTEALGSPLNMLFPEIVRGNLDSFRDTFAEHGVQGRVYFAHKSNRSDSVIRQLAVNEGYVDVSSSAELGHALSCGVQANRLEATGPKNADFLSLCILQGVTVNVDSLFELAHILKLRVSLQVKHPTNILLRLSGFEARHTHFLNKASRFGIPLNELDEAFSMLETVRDQVNFLGFSFHLDTVSVIERAVAIENCWQLFENALARGFEPRVLNIGGGYKVNYLASEQEWNDYTTALKEAVLGTGPSITWQGNGFGMSADKGKLRGNFNSYTYYDQLSGAAFLDELLRQKLPGQHDTTCGALLRDNMIELWIEPGRSLLDQSGITVARVNSNRLSSRGDNIVCLNMKRHDICFLDQEIFVDPIVIYQDDTAESSGQCVGVYLAGNLCLESDLVYRHKIFLPKLPQPGDLVVFVNTAGYFMDFNASHSIMHPIAQKVAVWQRGDEFKWALDSQYSPITTNN